LRIVMSNIFWKTVRHISLRFRKCHWS
jgi:hypothetical protein